MAKTPTQFKISKLVSLQINTKVIADKSFIPKDIDFEDNKTALEQVGIAINHNIPVLLVGETGVGKTALVRHLASKTNNAFVRVNHNGGTTVEDIIGRYTIDEKGTVWNDGLLIKAMKEGYWYLADEINAASAEINFAYHSLLDDDKQVVLAERGHEVVTAHPNFRFFGAMNPPAEYAGTKELNKALNSRFAVVKVDYVPPKIEAKIIMNRAGVPQEVADRMVKVAAEIRATHAKGSVRFVMSTRELIMWAQMFKIYGKYMASAQVSVLNKISEDDKQAMTTLFSLHFKTDDGIREPAKPVGDASEDLTSTLGNAPIGSAYKTYLSTIARMKNAGQMPTATQMQNRNPSTWFDYVDYSNREIVARDGTRYNENHFRVEAKTGEIIPILQGYNGSSPINISPF